MTCGTFHVLVPTTDSPMWEKQWVRQGKVVSVAKIDSCGLSAVNACVMAFLSFGNTPRLLVSTAIISDDGAAGVVKARVFDRAADDRLDDNGGKRK